MRLRAILLFTGIVALMLTNCAHHQKTDVYIPEKTSVVDKQFNFHVVAPGFWRSGQPNHESIVRMKDHGLKTLINFRGDETTNMWEKNLCDSLGIIYYNFHIDYYVDRDMLYIATHLFHQALVPQATLLENEVEYPL